MHLESSNASPILMPHTGVQKSTRSPNRTCKTCTPCRKKKIKCDGGRPQCVECTTSSLVCIYPQDARREPRPSRTRVQTLEMTVLALVEHMKTAGIVPPQSLLGEGENGEAEMGEDDEQTQYQNVPSATGIVPAAAAAGQLLTPSISGYSPDKHDVQPGYNLPPTQPDEAQALPMIDREPSLQRNETDQAENHDDKPEDGSGMSPCEARVAGAFHDDGCVSSVHGLASIMNPTLRAQHKANISTMVREGENAIAASRARLISNAALQRQREPRIFRHLSNTVDLDGCEPELARHLLDIHFNRQHYAYLISYRPAIMESIAGGGPWVNKLLLNAIYFSGTLYSDRPGMRGANPSDQSSLGAHFYRRFRQLLSEEITRPSIPSAAGLLLISAALVSQGQSSAGWNLAGIAYRMIIDMGCHLMLGADYQQQSTGSREGGAAGAGHNRLLRRDLEQEMRRRLYWGAYVTDATQSLYLGRPCMFATAEARVPLLLLDSFEEFEDWQPYVDPSSRADHPPPGYSPQPAHAVSTFNALVRLFQISTRITELYGIQTMKCTPEDIQETKCSIERDLENWRASLPAHLRFDPDEPYTPPPHQITPHTTFHALTILLQRAFLEEGHLRRYSTETTRDLSEQACITSALAIQRLVRAYKQAFTLRRAPFLLSYAIYCAVIVILRQERHERGLFVEPISFFWGCLGELRGGCNLGLEKPLGVLRELVREFQVSHGNGNGDSGSGSGSGARGGDAFGHGHGHEMAFPNNEAMLQFPGSQMANMDMPGEEESPEFQDGGGDGMGMLDLGVSPGFMASWNQLENDISQDTLYGLFAPPQAYL
ncbi:fungal-specific transcription factor domain-containing protein [Aspergillus crustosus]